MKNILNQFYPLFKKYPTRLTPHAELAGLLEKLRPMNPGKELIRIGPQGDGGYLLPDDLDGLTACYSPGVAYTSTFEMECAERGMQVFMADRSVEAPAEDHPNFHFIKKFIGAVGGEDFMTLEEWVEQTTPGDGDWMLQMDIEGAEYEVLLGTSPELLSRFRILVIEFHSLKNFWSRPFFQLASRALEKLLQTHVCVHNHPNNVNTFKKIGPIEMPSVTEMTFLRRDRAPQLTPATRFPHPLDCDNSDAYPPRPLPRCWHSPAS